MGFTNEKWRQVAIAVVAMLEKEGASMAEMFAVTMQIAIGAWSAGTGQRDACNFSEMAHDMYEDTMRNKAAGHVPP